MEIILSDNDPDVEDIILNALSEKFSDCVRPITWCDFSEEEYLDEEDVLDLIEADFDNSEEIVQALLEIDKSVC